MKSGRVIQVLSLKNRAGKLDPELAAVVQAIWQLERRIFPKHESLCSTVLQEVQRKNCCVLFAVEDVPGKEDAVVLGYIMFSCTSLVASITKLAVRENCRRSGYGEELLRTAIEHIQERNLHCVNLHVDTTREPAIALYKKLGFKVDVTVHSYYAPNRDAYRMVLSVDDLTSRSTLRAGRSSPVRTGFCVGAREDWNERGVLSGYRIVLVSPQEAGNVGSVCRLAANFECQDVWLVDPHCDYKGPVGHAMAANSVSRALLDNVRVSGTLAEALDECNMGIAFTRRSGAKRIPNMSFADMPLPVKSSVIALVFGREDSGLNSAEVLQCNHICSIPSGKWEGSLNLSHAVAVVLSRLFDGASQYAIADSKAPRPLRPYSWAFKCSAGSASIGEIENLLSRWTELMFSLNRAAAMASKPEYKAPERFIAQVRKVLQRAAPSYQDVAYVQGFLTLVGNVASITIPTGHNETQTERQLDISATSGESCDATDIK